MIELNNPLNPGKSCYLTDTNQFLDRTTLQPVKPSDRFLMGKSDDGQRYIFETIAPIIQFKVSVKNFEGGITPNKNRVNYLTGQYWFISFGDNISALVSPEQLITSESATESREHKALNRAARWWRSVLKQNPNP